MLRPDDFQKSHLLKISWDHGSEYGGHLPTAMVMHCIMNRVHAGWGSLTEVLDRLPYFAATEVMPVVAFPNMWNPGFVKLLHEVDGVFNKSVQDMTKGALYWCDLRRVERQWFKDNILGNQAVHPRVADCNSLVFFK